MTCESEKPESLICQNCILKDQMKLYSLGGSYILSENVPANTKIERKKGNGWTSTPNQKTITCNEGVVIDVL